MYPSLVALENSLGKSVLTQIHDPFLESKAVELWIKRDDLLHPVISGNKWRKLKYNLDDALSKDVDTLISMGGAYSNHLHALAFVGKTLKLKTIGIIRGEHPTPLTPTLQDMENWRMKLRFVTRSEYRLLRNHKHWQDLPGIKLNQYWLPEGGANPLALKGVGEIVDEIDISYDVLCVACGTGTTLAGLIRKAPKQKTVLGFAALNKARYLESDVKSQLIINCHNWEIFHDYHFGGFAKLNSKLALFINDFEAKTSVPLEPVYTGKMLYGIYDLIIQGRFKPGQRIVAIHTGGLQGKRGYL
ncbi:MAG: 1-aminocyclopropane-1-carboxylate deaminase/D-cysteine desulfhydrase [Methylococcaceae bacterium]|nr:1-aminocyclopropane-1-carboxylate deaminase/D-cysteine desulfhydrase [Methylococcaceae bacterium]